MRPGRAGVQRPGAASSRRHHAEPARRRSPGLRPRHPALPARGAAPHPGVPDTARHRGRCLGHPRVRRRRRHARRAPARASSVAMEPRQVGGRQPRVLRRSGDRRRGPRVVDRGGRDAGPPDLVRLRRADRRGAGRRACRVRAHSPGRQHHRAGRRRRDAVGPEPGRWRSAGLGDRPACRRTCSRRSSSTPSPRRRGGDSAPCACRDSSPDGSSASSCSWAPDGRAGRCCSSRSCRPR